MILLEFRPVIHKDLFNNLFNNYIIYVHIRPVREGVSTDRRKFHAGPPSPTLIRHSIVIRHSLCHSIVNPMPLHVITKMLKLFSDFSFYENGK
jgi:hypothetical protein